MTPQELREQYEKEATKKWWTNPVCHGEVGFASWDYQMWLESRLIERDKQLSDLKYEIYRRDCVQACVTLMGESVRTFFDKECSFQEEFERGDDPEQVAMDNKEAM